MFPLYDRNPTRTKPVVTRALIVANVVIFFATQWLQNRGVMWIAPGYGLVPSRLSADPSGESIKIFTSMFLHANFVHLAGNMLFLHIFGDNIEDAVGRVRYVGLYLLAGVVGALSHYMTGPTSPIPLIGASGAIAGVLGAYLVLYPRAPITILNPFIIPLPLLIFPAWFVVGYWFVWELIRSLLALGDFASHVAYLAHVGGFLTGLLLVRTLAGDDLHTQNEWSGWRPPPRKPQRPIFKKDQDGPFWRDKD